MDTCAAEFEANTPYMYSCYDGVSECEPTKARKVSAGGGCFPDVTCPPFLCVRSNLVLMFLPSHPQVLILGGGPNRIGQGIEFDYCCCHAAYSLR